MITLNNSTNSPYIFWLFDCSSTHIAIRLRITPRYVRCDISSDGIVLHDTPQSVHIPFSELQDCEIYELPGVGEVTGLNLRIKFAAATASEKTPLQSTELFLLTANVFKHRGDLDDLKTMFKVIQAFRNGQTIDVEKNPYHRRLLRQGQADRIKAQTWDSTLPPSHYSTPPTLGRLLLRLLIVVPTVTLVGTLVVVLIYYLVTEVF